MTREILFKAKRLDNGEWASGSLVCFAGGERAILPSDSKAFFSNKGFICCDTCHDVDPSTVCEYSGLTDKSGKKSFEGDIISIENPKPCAPWICKVVYENCCWWLDGQSRVAKVMLTDYADVEMEIIGSIHDGEGVQ